MKILVIMATVAASLFTNVSSAKQLDDVTPAAIQSFKTTFGQATEVNWSISENFYKADFVLNGQYATVYYDCEGRLMATTRNITSLQLPITLQASLKKEYSEFWISELFELTNNEGTSYYVTIQKADTKITLKSASHSAWESFQKTSKL
jgi:hypothetical protein